MPQRTSPLQCAECNVQCADKKALDRHRRSAHKVAHNCDQCGAKLASEKSLARHKKKHLVEVMASGNDY